MPFFESGLDLALAARMRTLPAPRRVRPSGLKVVPRMIRGPEPAWRPDTIWGQFNHAMG